MTKRFPVPILLVCAAVGVACGSERALEPSRVPVFIPPVFTTFTVGPSVAELYAVLPGYTVQLSILPLNQNGALMPLLSAPTYSSSAPAIAEVSTSGVVRANAPGTAVINVELTLGGITRAAFMTAKVHGPDEASDADSEIAGVYDLSALITHSDPVWGIEDGTRQTAVITIQHYRSSGRFAGSFEDFCAVSPSGKSCSGNPPGFVIGTIDPTGHVVIELFNAGSRSSYWYGEGTLASREIVGGFGAGGHISGTFIAKRREAEAS